MSVRKALLCVVLATLVPSIILAVDRKPRAEPPPEFYPARFVIVHRGAPTEPGPAGGLAAIGEAEARIGENADQAPLEEAPPECTPFRASIDKAMQEVTFEDPNEAWPVFTVELTAWKNLTKYGAMKECLESLPKYHGRYTDEQIRNLEKGKITAGMPYEFALMVLGAPAGPPSYLSILNPVTERAEECWSYSWVNLGSGVGAAAFFSVLGGAALGFAGHSNSLGDVSKYLRVAAIAQIGEAVAWQTVLHRAQFVSVQVSSNKTIRAVLAQ